VTFLTRARGAAAGFAVAIGYVLTPDALELVPLPVDQGAPASADAELFAPGEVSTPLDELNAAFSPDGRELYYSITAPDAGMGVIVQSRLRGGRWSVPEVVSFSGRHSDYDPFLSADGRQLYFISNRPAGDERKPPSDFDVWVVERAGDGWGEPRNLGAPVNTTRPEYYPSVARDGTLYFSANRDGGQGGFDVYRARLVDGRYQEPENLGANVNGRSAEIDNYVAPDQSFIIFASYGRPDDLGRGDLYISYFRDGAWTPARNLGPAVNSAAREYCPIGSPDGKWLYWTSKRGFADQPAARRLTMRALRDSLASLRNGGGNIYRLPLSAVLDGGV
jgi:Tol biopolymer transport system component